MNNVKIENIQHVYLNGKKATVFNVYSLKNGAWYLNYSDFIFGWYKKESTIKKKHIAINF